MLHDILEYKRKLLNPTPPRPFNAEHNIPIRLASGVVIPAPDDAAEELELDKVPLTRSESRSCRLTRPASGPCCR